MNTEAIFNAAQSTAIKLIESGAFIPPDSTVCAVQSLSGRIYTGVSHPEMNNGMQTLVHAEVDAVRNMLAANDNGIEAMLLINTQSRMPMLPCPNCIGYILSLDPRNQNCAVMMQDRMLNINEAGMYAAPMNNMGEPKPFGGSVHAAGGFFNAQPVQVQPVVSKQLHVDNTDEITANTEFAKGNLLRNKVNNLLDGVEDDEDEEDESSSDKGKGIKGLFGRFKK